jgi:hypothetical protein
MYRLSIPPYMNRVNRAVVLCKKFQELQVFFRIKDLYHKVEIIVGTAALGPTDSSMLLD